MNELESLLIGALRWSPDRPNYVTADQSAMLAVADWLDGQKRIADAEEVRAIVGAEVAVDGVGEQVVYAPNNLKINQDFLEDTSQCLCWWSHDYWRGTTHELYAPTLLELGEQIDLCKWDLIATQLGCSPINLLVKLAAGRQQPQPQKTRRLTPGR